MYGYILFTKYNRTISGNKYIALLTSQGNRELRIDLEDWNGDKRYALFESFKVGDQSTNYTLTISGYSGSAGNQYFEHIVYTYTTGKDLFVLNLPARNSSLLVNVYMLNTATIMMHCLD